MADNIDVTPGTGKTIAADDIGGILHQRVKIAIGADGSYIGDVSDSTPLPVRDIPIKSPVGKYATRIEIIPTTLTADTAYFCLFNPPTSGKEMAINKIILQSGYLNTNSSSTASYFKVEKFIASARYTGVAPVYGTKFKTSYPGSLSEITLLQGGLTAPSGVVVLPYFHEHMVRSESRVADLGSIDFGGGELYDDLLFIGPGEGFLISAESLIIQGAALVGSVYWHEYVV